MSTRTERRIEILEIAKAVCCAGAAIFISLAFVLWLAMERAQ